ncbi:proline reductase-associated electron transfer protein PrdC [Bifidobacterium aquikefiri]|uniref:proline reductase-associated electron transfer protein PrdC n=1 Tax=Bifidobacterium aquikefiri TaxID=1653207 RepID=UPI0023F2F2A0|nr:proline reductase-associated electron transfer protein PrdC [Bifidobacterium aquikefiri]
MMDRQYRVIPASLLFGEYAVKKLPAELTQTERIRQSGLVGMGGAGFPMWKKLSFGKGCHVVIANAAECEPLLEHNVARIESNPQEILSGLTIAMHEIGAERGIIAIKAKHEHEIASLRSALADTDIADSHFDIDQGIEIKIIEDRYPAGDERAIVRDVLGVLLEPNELPSKAGAVVSNVETLMRLHRAVVNREVVGTKDITVAGNIEGSGYENKVSLVLYDVPIDVSVGEVLDALHIQVASDAQLLMGGPYMGGEISAKSGIAATSGGIIIAGPEIRDHGPMGIIVCACGASEDRLKAIVASKGASLCGIEMCKNVCRLPNGRLKCRNPGVCPGQAQAVLALKKKGAQSILISHCTDCTNTVMQIAPKIGMRVHHATDAYMIAGGEHLIRSFRKTTTVSQA